MFGPSSEDSKPRAICWRVSIARGSSWMGALQSSSGDFGRRSGVVGERLAISSDVRLPSSEGIEFNVGTRRLMTFNLAKAAGESDVFGGTRGDRGDVADFSFWIVGHEVGEGITSEGRLSRRTAVRSKSCLMEFEHLSGTTAESSSSEMSYRSSKSV